MELVSIIEKLWRHRLLVALGCVVALFAAASTIYKLTLLPPTATPRSIEFGSASTQVLIDADLSPLLDLNAELEPLSSRAEVYARLVESNEVRDAIARRARIPAEAIVIEGRGGEAVARVAREPAAEQRANQLRGEAQANRILFVAETGLPVVSIYTQSATAEGAEVLAKSAAGGLVSYLTELQSARNVPDRRKVAFRTLGDPQGGMVNDGASRMVAALAFISVLVLWCLGVLAFSGLLEGLAESRRRREDEAAAPLPLDEPEPEPRDEDETSIEDDAVFDFEPRRERVG